MSVNRDFTLKRYTGTVYDKLLPTTHVGQVYADDTLTDTLQNLLDAKISSSEKGSDGGVVPLTQSGKIADGYLPDTVFGGMKFMDAITENTDVGPLVDAMAVQGVHVAPGRYYIAATKITLTHTGPGNISIVQPGVQGDYAFPIELEASDWLLYSHHDAETDTHYVAIVNNTYSAADDSTKGIVKLSNISGVTTGTTGNQVITQGVLSGLIGTGSDKLAVGDHNHSSLYQPLDSDLTVIAGLTTTNNNMIVGNGTSWSAKGPSEARSALGLGTLAIQSSINNTDWSGTELSLSNGGTGSATATGARTNLGVVIGTDVQAHDNNLDTISAFSAANMGSIERFGNIEAAALNSSMLVHNGSEFQEANPLEIRTAIDVYDQSEVDGFLDNRPQILYGTTSGASNGDLIIELD